MNGRSRTSDTVAPASHPFVVAEPTFNGHCRNVLNGAQVGSFKLLTMRSR